MFCHHQKGGDCWPGPMLQSPILLSFDDYKTYIVICTNHVYCLSVFQGSKDSWSVLPLRKVVLTQVSSFRVQDTSFSRSHMEEPT